MEKLIDFDQWYLNYKLPPVKFVAVFDPNTGMVLSVGPSHAFVNEKNKIPLDDELALSIIALLSKTVSLFLIAAVL